MYQSLLQKANNKKNYDNDFKYELYMVYKCKIENIWKQNHCLQTLLKSRQINK